jgi:phosphonate transport system permease protein
VLGFVSAGGIAFELLSAMNLFQYRLLLSIIAFVTVFLAERLLELPCPRL